MILVKENSFKFKVEIKDRISVVDTKNKTGYYVVVGRHWDAKKGSTIELVPEQNTAFAFYRLMIPQKNIIRTKTEICASIIGNQFKQYYTRPVKWESPVIC